MKMGEKEKYLDELNTTFGKYLKTKSIYSYKQVKRKMKEGENKYSYVFRDYYWMHPRWSVTDFDKSLNEDVKLLKSLWTKWRKVFKGGDDMKLSNELYTLHHQVSINLTAKCAHKFSNGKYYIVKTDNRVYLHFEELFNQTVKKINRSLPEKPEKDKTKKFDNIREYANKLKKEIRPQKKYEMLWYQM